MRTEVHLWLLVSLTALNSALDYKISSELQLDYSDSLDFLLDLSEIIPRTAELYEQSFNSIPKRLEAWFTRMTEPHVYESMRVPCDLDFKSYDVNCYHWGRFNFDECVKQSTTEIGSCLWSSRRKGSECGLNFLDEGLSDGNTTICVSSNKVALESDCGIRGMSLKCYHKDASGVSGTAITVNPIFYFIRENSLVKKIKLIVENDQNNTLRSVNWGRAAIGILCPGCWGFFGGGSSDTEVLSGIQGEMKALEKNMIDSINKIESQINQLEQSVNELSQWMQRDIAEVTNIIMRIINVINYFDQIHFKILDLELFFTRLSALPEIGISSLSPMLDLTSLSDRIRLETGKYPDLDLFEIVSVKNGFLLKYPYSKNFYRKYDCNQIASIDGKLRTFKSIYINANNSYFKVDDVTYRSSSAGLICSGDECILEKTEFVIDQTFYDDVFAYEKDDVITMVDSDISMSCMQNKTWLNTTLSNQIKVTTTQCSVLELTSKHFNYKLKNLRTNIDPRFPVFMEIEIFSNDTELLNFTTFQPATINFSDVDDKIKNLESMSNVTKIITIIIFVIFVIILLLLICTFLPKLKKFF